MDPTYGQHYRRLYEEHWWWRAREAIVLRELARLRPAAGWRRALDVGCGDGLLLDRLAQQAERVEGVEPDERLLSDAGRARRIHVGPFDSTFAPDGNYDLILFLDVLEHIQDAAGAVRRAGELLEAGGIMIVTVPAFMHLWTRHDELNHHVKRYRRSELVDLLSPVADLVVARYMFRWVHLAKLAQRLSESLRDGEPGVPRIPAAPVNRLLTLWTGAEDRLLGRIPVAIGSSLLAIARKP